MSSAAPSSSPQGRAPQERVRVDGKFFRLGADKFPVKGVTYGPFDPAAEHGPFASPDQTRRDMALVRDMGANVLRLYELPPPWLLDLALEMELRLLVDVPWPKHLCFLDHADSRLAARRAVRHAAQACAEHPAVFALSVVNEIPADIVRWSKRARVERFIETLIEEVKSIAPHCLCTFASFPPTEFLQADNVDFLCFNVYLHQRDALAAYLARLQTLADARPLVLGEFGMDAIREGEENRCAFMSWQIETAFQAGLAGVVAFSFTDDWHRGGGPVENWAFGLTTRDRQPKPAFQAVKAAYAHAPRLTLPRAPRVSVVVASYNGGRTLRACLESLMRQSYPDFEVILVDDGSTDDTPEIAARFPSVKVFRQPNRGLSVARNAGLSLATGDIVAYTDSDCRADEDWLFYLVGDLARGDYAAIGGHNFLPPDDSPVAAAVMASPGGPAHVMVSDVEAEHVPGCNMAFFKWALEELGGFDPVFTKAGDDVDICWRLRERGHRIGFSAAGFVWHYRRATAGAYLRQQRGYGEAEALLARKHPEYFNTLGGSVWRGRIYSTAHHGVMLRRPVIYHGAFGSGFFQRIYQPGSAHFTMLGTSLEYYLCVVLPVGLLTLLWTFLWPLMLISLLIPAFLCAAAGWQATLPRKLLRPWSRPLVACLFLCQPIARGLARYQSGWNDRSGPRMTASPSATSWMAGFRIEPGRLAFWSDGSTHRFAFLDHVLSKLEREGWQVRPDNGWSEHDLEISGSRWNKHRLVTVAESLEQGRLNLRCCVDSCWSLRARMLFALFVGSSVFAANVLAKQTPWAWMLLPALGVFAWILDLEKLRIQSRLMSVLESAASELHLTKINATDGLDHPDKPAA